MIHIKYSHTITLDKIDQHTARLRLVIYYNAHRVALSLGYIIELDKWNHTTNRPQPRTTHGKHKVPAHLITATIQRYQDTTDHLFATYSAQDHLPTPQELRNDLTQALGRPSANTSQNTAPTLAQLLTQYITTQATLNQWADGTLRARQSIKQTLLSYTPNATTDQLNKQWLQGLHQHLIHTNQLNNNTLQDRLKRIKIILQWGTDNGYPIPTDYQKFNPHITTTRKEIIYLEWEELMALYHYPFAMEYQQHVRDCFCLQCFTSLRYSDLRNLLKTHITPTHIIVTTQKTTDLLHINLNDYSRTLLERYAHTTTPQAMPIYTNQVYNRYLKEICAIAGIDTLIPITDIKGGKRTEILIPKYNLITSHAGRRTFICHALRLGISPSIVMKFTGHSDYNAMRPYIGAMETAKEQAMQLFNTAPQDTPPATAHANTATMPPNLTHNAPNNHEVGNPPPPHNNAPTARKRP